MTLPGSQLPTFEPTFLQLMSIPATWILFGITLSYILIIIFYVRARDRWKVTWIRACLAGATTLVTIAYIAMSLSWNQNSLIVSGSFSGLVIASIPFFLATLIVAVMRFRSRFKKSKQLRILFWWFFLFFLFSASLVACTFIDQVEGPRVFYNTKLLSFNL